MAKQNYKVIAVMSGTSLDGIDIIYSRYTFNGEWHFKILNTTTIPYSQHWKKLLSNLPEKSIDFLKVFDKEYSTFLAEIIKDFIRLNKIEDIDFIASHGHTALHQPDKKLTYQIGNLPILAEILNKKVICDFRVQDVKFGGQGAPLVPIGDRLLFSNYDYCLNLGGFANVSFEKNNDRIAFDICPVNIVLNRYVSKINLDYDNKGQIASSGTVQIDLLNELNKLEFYKQNPPKSLGLEWVEKCVFPLIDKYKPEIQDILRTFVEHIAVQISNQINSKSKKVLVTGGGAYSDFLISRIRFYSDSEIIIPSKEIIEYKEALIFGLLGILKDRGEINCLKSVTGAKRDHSSGKILLPKN